MFGTANAKTITIGFYIYTPKAGTYCISVRNGVNDRSYIAEYVIAAGEVNTWAPKAVVIPGDTTGTWSRDNTAGIYVSFVFGCGATATGVTGWQAGFKLCSASQVNGVDATRVISLADVSLTEGTVAPPFVVPDYASELAACQRYFRKWGQGAKGIWITG